MRLLTLFLLALAAYADTTVTATYATATGDKPSGSCSIQALGLASAGGFRLIGAPTVSTFSAGAFSQTLVPTDGATPSGQYYRVTCQVPSQRAASGRAISGYSWGPVYWLVPTSSTPLDVSAVEIAGNPGTPSMALLPRTAPAGTADGSYCVQVVNGIVTGLIACASGGLPAGSPFDSYTDIFDSSTGLFDAH